ncbi:MAG TPA: zinc ribbon domain-containing protein [Desulfotignum sp.]|jgi:putative FmdB family regulatory protein|nr:zinc ribbon domain-containing protein [Desulfotignum sp.]
MPVYEYQCSACKHIEEAFQKISDPPLATCPRCSGSLSKIISHSAFHLKGSGWYVTDYGGAKTQSDTAEKPAAESAKTACAAPSDTAKKQDVK